MDLSDVARELYRVAPRDFVAARKKRAADVKDSDPALAGDIAKLPKPSTSAWVVDVLASEGPAIEHDFEELAAQLRVAQADPDRTTVSRLVSERRKLIASALTSARKSAESMSGAKVGQSALDQAEQTLLAALSDPDALAAVFSGRLIRSLEPTGFEPVELSGAVAGGRLPAAAKSKPSAKAQSSSAPTKRAKDRKAAVDAANRAKASAAKASKAVDDVIARGKDNDAAKAELEHDLEELRDRFGQLEATQAKLAKQESALDRELARAKDAKRRADEVARMAQSRTDRLN